MAKIKSITVKGPLDRLVSMNDTKTEIQYRVERVTDSIEFSPDEWLHKSQVQELCESAEWKVTVLPFFNNK